MPCAVAHIELRAPFTVASPADILSGSSRNHCVVEKLFVLSCMKAPRSTHPTILAFLNIFRFAIVSYIDLHDCWPM